MYYFIGIKGSGMASLAEIVHDLGYEVSGSDIGKYIFIEEELKKRNIPIYSFNKENIKDGYTVIIGNAFNRSNEEVAAALDNPNVTTYGYCEFLGKLFERYVSIGIAGTHGKTTTTGMAYHLFKEYDKTNVLIGDGTGYSVKDAHYFISEVDEFQDHFLHYHNDYALINNIELDHVDYFKSMDQYLKSFETYANQAKKEIVIWGDDPYLPKLNYTKPVVKFGLNKDNDIRAVNVINNEKGLSFDVYAHGELFGHFALEIYGMQNLYDLLGVITLGYLEGMDAEYIQKRMSTFKGVKRRYTITECQDCVFIDDYAHHPTAIKYVMEETRTRFPGKTLVAIFQPDRFTRGVYFAKRFAESMNMADYVYFIDFPANAVREPGIGEDVDIHVISDLLPRAKVITEDDETAKMLANTYKNAAFLMMSSKDIYKFQEKIIEAKENLESA